jgi:glutamate-1-semialdehyde aminotransferase/spore coat polysaccharide biosynthesis protein SpsF (cytidylyltransferase family)
VARQAGFQAFRGSLDDVLGRVVGAARSVGAATVIRATGDCPLLDPVLLDQMLHQFAGGGYDYLSNISPPTFPDGLDLEIMTIAALERADREASAGHQREHVTPFLRDNPQLFRLGCVTNPRGDQSRYHWSVDRPADLELVAEITKRVDKDVPLLDDWLNVVDKDEDLRRRSMKSVQRNEGASKTFLEDIEKRKPRPRIEQSNALWKRAQDLIPAGTQTLSKGPTQFVRGFAPKYIAKGKGSHVWDVDGNEYIDYPLGLGPITLGHAHPEVNAAIVDQLENGVAFSMMHPLEVKLAERIREMVPCAEMVRFGKNGSDATSACIRASRAKTGRSHVARCGYHGWQDWSIDASYGIRARGVLKEVMDLTHSFPYNDLGALERLLGQYECAAVILEPVSVTPPAPGFLQGVRELASKYGAVLVFDEVITGFRFARGGAQEHFGVLPDLAAMGKGVANGLPLSLVVGKRDFMQPFEEIFFSFTFGGEAASLAAAMATLDVMERENYWQHVWKQGAKLQHAYRELAGQHRLTELTDCGGLPPWTVITFQDSQPWSALQLKSLFQQEMIRHGILFSGSQFISLAHSDDDIERTIHAYGEAFRVLRFALDCTAVDYFTQGEPIELIFRRA